jgi:hypothetical protein
VRFAEAVQSLRVFEIKAIAVFEIKAIADFQTYSMCIIFPVLCEIWTCANECELAEESGQRSRRPGSRSHELGADKRTSAWEYGKMPTGRVRTEECVG